MWPALLFSNKDLFFASFPEHSEHLFLNNEETAEPVIDHPGSLIILGAVFLFALAFVMTGVLTQRWLLQSFFPSAKTMQTFFGPEMTSEPLLSEEDLEVGRLGDEKSAKMEDDAKMQEGCWEPAEKLQSSMGPGGPCRREGSAERRNRRVLGAEASS